MWKDICKSHAVTLDAMTRKYGKEEGHKRYESFLDKTLKNFISKSSIECLDEIQDKLNIKIRHGKNSTEKKIDCGDSLKPVDGYCEDLDIVFEFYGDAWHVNPEIYNSEKTNPRGQSALDVWEYDKKREKCIIDNTKLMIVIWEQSWIKRKSLVIKTISELLDKFKENKLIKGVYYV